MAKCPYCGRPVVLARGGNWQAVNHHNLELTTGGGAAAATRTDYERRAPAREPTIAGDVAVPGLQAAITGAIGAAVTAGGSLAIGYPFWASMQAGAAGGLAVLAVTWLARMGAHNRLLWMIETITGGDDRATAAPPPPPVLVEVTNDTGNGGTMRRFELPKGVTESMFRNWAQQTAAGIKTPARAQWVGRGKPFSRGQYEALVGELETAGIVHDNGDGAGRRLTLGGRRAMARIGGRGTK